MITCMSRRRMLELGGKGLAVAASAGAGITLIPNESLAIDWLSWFRRDTKMEQGGKVLTIEGRAFADEKPLQVGQTIHSGQQVNVSRPGSVVIVLEDNTIFKLYGGAIVELALKRMEQTIIRLITGAIQAVVPAGSNFLLAGPVATVGVKGTVIYREVFGEDPEPGKTMEGDYAIPAGVNDYFCNCFGDVNYLDRHTGETFHTSHAKYHEGYFLDPATKGLLVKAPMLNHFDNGIRELIAQQPGKKHDTSWLKH